MLVNIYTSGYTWQHGGWRLFGFDKSR